MAAGSGLVYLSSIDSELLSQLEVYTVGTSGPTLQAVKAKCRELVRSDSLLLAGPVDSKRLYVVCKKKYFTSATKEELSLKFNIQLLGEGGYVSLSLLKYCYEFTIKGRLSPKWNEIDEWLVKGSDVFITGRTLALKLDIQVSVNQLIVSITSHKLTVRHLQPVDLGVTSSVLRLFTEGVNSLINEESISANHCYVLPNLTEAHVYSVSHVTPPTNSQFNSYDSIRQHWKKQYGFILPSTQSLFYQIFFSFNPTSYLSYPGCCVIRGRPLVIPSNNAHEIGETFINDIHTRVPTLCGLMTHYTSKNPLALVNRLMNPSIVRYPPNTRPVSMAIRKRPLSLGNPNIPKIPQTQSYGSSPSDSSERVLSVPPHDGLKRKRHFEEEEQVSSKRYQTVPDIQCIQGQEVQVYGVSSVEEIKLQKSKVPALKSWLQSHNVHYQSRDKKETLINLIKSHITSTGTHYN